MPGSTKTYLAWLKEVPGKPSPEAFLKVIKQLEYIRQLNLNVDTKGIHPNRLRQLSRLGARYEPFLFRRFKDPLGVLELELSEKSRGAGNEN